MFKKIKILAIACGLIVATSCELDLLDNPNAVTISSADNNFLLNRLQLDARNLFTTGSGFGMAMTRMINQGNNTYQAAYTPITPNGMWNNAYANILVDADALIARADAGNLTTHAGIARVIKAYALMTLVDFFNDVPYSQALDPNEFNPQRDQAASVYAAALSLLDAAIANFGVAPLAAPANDFFYGGNRASWTKLAKALKLKLLLNRSLVSAGDGAAINALITEADLPGTAAESWRFPYSTERANPDSRHPRFIANYVTGGSQYQSNYYMWHLTEAKKGTTGYAGVPGDGGPSPDPRAPYYFNRQVTLNPTDINELRCINETEPQHYTEKGFLKSRGLFCLPGVRGYWGRDHLDNQGIPPDNLKRTVPGIYPAGGRFDRAPAVITNNQNLGNQGAGIEPMMERAYVQFMIAEAELRINNNPAAALTRLTNGITASINDVRAFALTTLESAAVTTAIANAAHDAARNNYVANVTAEYNAAASNTDRMRIIAREYWLALYGNGVEAHNLYRRTGQPDGMQPGLNANFGTYPRTLLYPNDHVARNRNAEQRDSMADRVFWDNNPQGAAWID